MTVEEFLYALGMRDPSNEKDQAAAHSSAKSRDGMCVCVYVCMCVYVRVCVSLYECMCMYVEDFLYALGTYIHT